MKKWIPESTTLSPLRELLSRRVVNRSERNRRARLVALLACTLGAAGPIVPSHAAAEASPADTASLADLPTRWRAGAPIVALGSPTDLALAPDGRRAYLINGYGCTVEVLDLATGTLIGAPIVVGFEPSAIAVTPDGALACVANWRDFSVSVIDLPNDEVIGGPIALRGFVDRSGATDVVVTPDGRRALVTISEGRFVGVVDLARHRVVSRIKLGDGGPSSIVITRDGSRALVATGGFDALWTIDLARDRVVGTPVTLSGTPGDMAVSPDGTSAYVLVNSRDAHTVSIVDMATGSLIGEPISAGIGSCDCPNASIAITPDAKHAYLANSGDADGRHSNGGVTMIDLVQRKVTGSLIEAGPHPTALAITADGTRAYVLNSGDGTISTIDLATNEVTGAPIAVGRYRSVARRRLLAAEQLRHLEAAADSLFSTSVVPRSGIKLVDLINGAGTERRGGVKADYFMRKIRELREEAEKPCPICEKWPTGFNNGLTNMILDLRQRLDAMMDSGWPTRAEGQPLFDVLTAVSMELGFW